jgi:hypothetical protein
MRSEVIAGVGRSATPRIAAGSASGLGPAHAKTPHNKRSPMRLGPYVREVNSPEPIDRVARLKQPANSASLVDKGALEICPEVGVGVVGIKP